MDECAENFLREPRGNGRKNQQEVFEEENAKEVKQTAKESRKFPPPVGGGQARRKWEKVLDKSTEK
jgi:hypothetical protein